MGKAEKALDCRETIIVEFESVPGHPPSVDQWHWREGWEAVAQEFGLNHWDIESAGVVANGIIRSLVSLGERGDQSPVVQKIVLGVVEYGWDVYLCVPKYFPADAKDGAEGGV